MTNRVSFQEQYWKSEKRASTAHQLKETRETGWVLQMVSQLWTRKPSLLQTKDSEHEKQQTSSDTLSNLAKRKYTKN